MARHINILNLTVLRNQVGDLMVNYKTKKKAKHRQHALDRALRLFYGDHYDSFKAQYKTATGDDWDEGDDAD